MPKLYPNKSDFATAPAYPKSAIDLGLCKGSRRLYLSLLQYESQGNPKGLFHRLLGMVFHRADFFRRKPVRHFLAVAVIGFKG